ncbi:MAG: hypothetical protein ABJB86_16720, partial [Bacteroidota bacterium]
DSDDIIYPTGLEIFLNSMERFPGAALGITSFIGQEEKPYPFVMSPEEAYQYNFYTRGLFDTGPSGLIFRASMFREIGGFSGKRYVGDTEINLKLAAKWPVVRIGASLIFWRQHEGQEIAAGVNSTGYLELQLPMYQEAFSRPECPLPENKKAAIIQFHKKIAARQIIKIALQKKDPKLAMQFYNKLALSPSDLFNAVLFMKKSY